MTDTTVAASFPVLTLMVLLPLAGEKTDRTTSGTVIRGPDSWGWTGPSGSALVVQRGVPWKIMKKRRDM